MAVKSIDLTVGVGGYTVIAGDQGPAGLLTVAITYDGALAYHRSDVTAVLSNTGSYFPVPPVTLFENVSATDTHQFRIPDAMILNPVMTYGATTLTVTVQGKNIWGNNDGFSRSATKSVEMPNEPLYSPTLTGADVAFDNWDKPISVGIQNYSRTIASLGSASSGRGTVIRSIVVELGRPYMGPLVTRQFNFTAGSTTVTNLSTLVDQTFSLDNLQARFTVTNSIGRTTRVDVIVPLLPYNWPRIGSFNGFRCDEDLTPNKLGAWFAFSLTAEADSLGGINSIQGITFDYYQLSPGDNSPHWVSVPIQEGVVSGPYGDGTILPQHTIELSFTIADLIMVSMSSSVSMLPGEKPGINIMPGSAGIAFGKKATESGYADSAWPIKCPGLVVTGNGDIMIAGKSLRQLLGI